MSSDPVLGQLLDGRQLPQVPQNASRDEQTTILNEVIATLNSIIPNAVVASTSFLVDGTDPQVIRVKHNLGYVPQASCYISDQTITDSNGVTIPDVNIPLPAPLQFSESGGVIVFQVQMDYFTDATYLYIRVINADGATSVSPFVVNYELSRSPVPNS